MPYKPGESGNPAGKPKGSVHVLPKYRNKTLKQICKDLTLSVVMPRLEILARKRNEWAMETILHYAHGKPIQQIHQVNINMDYSSWTDEQIEEFEDTGQMPMLKEGQEPGSKQVKEPKE